MHGGASPVGPASVHWKHGRRSEYIPRHLLERFEQVAGDPNILSVREDIALLQARLDTTLASIRDNEAGAWSAAKAAAVAVRNAPAAGKAAAVMDLLRVVETGGMAEAWREVERFTDQKMRLVESERRLLEAAHGSLTIDKAMTMMQYILESLKRNVHDRDALLAVQADVRTLLR